jgi:hypothetical protein
MLTRLITDAYGALMEVALWVVLLLSAIWGYGWLGPQLVALDKSGNSVTYGIIAAVISVMGAFLVLVVVTGPILLLLEIRRSLRRIEGFNESANNRQQQARTAPQDRGIPEANNWSAT